MWKNLNLEWKILLLACLLLIAIAWPVQTVFINRLRATLAQSVDDRTESILRNYLALSPDSQRDSIVASLERQRQWKAMIPIIVKEQQAALLWFSAILFGALMLFALWTLRRMTRPLRQLASAVIKIGHGEKAFISHFSGGALGTLETSVATMQDELDFLREQARVQGMEKAWQDIAGIMAHEIKNPLTPIRLTLDRLEEKVAGGHDVSAIELTKCLSRINSQIDVLERLVDQFRSFSRDPEAALRPISAAKAISEVASDLAPNLTTSITGDAVIIADSHLWSQIILNIFKNALEAGATAVAVSIVKKETTVDCSIKDNGPGIPIADLSRVWLPYVSFKKGGTGLGLPVVKRLVETMQGSVSLISQTDGAHHGVTMFLTMPTADDGIISV